MSAGRCVSTLAMLLIAGCGTSTTITQTATVTQSTTVTVHRGKPITRTATVTTTTPATTVTIIHTATQSSAPAPVAPSAAAIEGPGSFSHATDTQFCSTHTCIENFPNGSGYIVQCVDGEWSHSGGRSGACSDHGGEG
jgi:hypothetical protein